MVRRREKPVKKAEGLARRSTFSDGTYLVGEEITPGTYRSANGIGECYWAEDGKSKRRPGARLVAGTGAGLGLAKCSSTDPDPWNPQLVPLRAARRVVVVDLEDGRIGVRRNERPIGRRPSGARDLAWIITALDEHGTVRKARPVRLRVAV